MITKHRKFSIRDASGRNESLDIEVNWSNNKSVRGCKHLKVTIRDEKVILSRDQLWMLIFMFSEEDQQEKMLPIVETVVRHHETIVDLVAKNDIKKGEKYAVHMTISQDPNTGQLLVKP